MSRRQSTEPASRREVLRAAFWLEGAPAAALDELAAVAVPRRLARGETLYVRGETPKGIYGLLDGRIRLSVMTSDGREILVGFQEPGDWFGDLSLLASMQRRFFATSVDEARLLLIPRDRLDEILGRHPLLYRGLVLLVGRRLKQAVSYVEDALLLPLPARLAKTLLALARAYGERVSDGTRITLRLPQEDLGSMLATSRQSVSKELKRWERAGWIRVEYGTIVLCADEPLRRLAESV